MKAMVYERFGPPDVLQLKQVPKPAPGENELLIRVHATTVTAGDRRVRSLDFPAGFGLIAPLLFGRSKPRQPILGTEVAGVVEAVGKNVRKFKEGDRVFAFPGASMGCYAEYRCMPEDGPIAKLPIGLSFAEAAALSSGGTTALGFLRRGKLQPGERVLINGASGSVGSAAVQLARQMGAEVTGVCSTANVELVRSLGAAQVLDYTREDFRQSGERYDVILDTVGTAPYSLTKRALTERGRLLLVAADLPGMLSAPWVSVTSRRKVIAGPAAVRAEDLRYLAELAAAGHYKPVIDRSYPFEELAEAHRYVDTGRKRGNVVITLEHLAATL